LRDLRRRLGPAPFKALFASYSDLDKAAGRTEVYAEPPALPAPDACTDPLGGYTLPGIALTERLEFRAAKVPGWMTGAPGNDPRMELWVRFRDGRAPDPRALAAIVDFLPPVVVDLGETTSSTIELTVHVRKRPEPGWLACRVWTRFVLDGLHEEDFEIWDSAGNLVTQSRQLALLPT
jgi:acyl-CoA thioesterase